MIRRNVKLDNKVTGAESKKKLFKKTYHMYLKIVHILELYSTDMGLNCKDAITTKKKLIIHFPGTLFQKMKRNYSFYFYFLKTFANKNNVS